MKAAHAQRFNRLDRLEEPAPEPEVEPRGAPTQDPWAALGKALKSPREGGSEAESSSDGDEDLLGTPRRGRVLLSIEAVDSHGRPPSGARGTAHRYHCLWEMIGVVMTYRQRTWETLDDLWDRGEDVRGLIRAYERENPGRTDLPPQLEDADGGEEWEAEAVEGTPGSSRRGSRGADAPGGAGALSGQWLAVGVGADGERLSELLLLHAQPDGALEGAVAGEDGHFLISERRAAPDQSSPASMGDVVSGASDGDADGCEISRASFSQKTGVVAFDQVYADGATTRWRARYDAENEMLVQGRWTGECEGTFEATRKVEEKTPDPQPEPEPEPEPELGPELAP